MLIEEHDLSDVRNVPLNRQRTTQFDQSSLGGHDVVFITEGDLGSDCVLMDRVGFLEGVTLVEIHVEVASDEVIRQFGV